MATTIPRFGITLAFIVASVTGLPARAADTGPIEPLLNDMVVAANAHDAQRFMAFYDHSPALTVTFDDMTIQGWQPLLDQQVQWWDNGKSTAVYTNVSAPRITVISDTVIASLQTLKVIPPGVVGKEARLTITSIWKKRPEGWRIVVAHESLTR